MPEAPPNTLQKTSLKPREAQEEWDVGALAGSEGAAEEDRQEERLGLLEASQWNLELKLGP